MQSEPFGAIRSSDHINRDLRNSHNRVMATKKRLSLFSFGLATSQTSHDDDVQSLLSGLGPKAVKGAGAALAESEGNGQLSSPMHLPVSQELHESFPEVEAQGEPVEPIFERSVQNAADCDDAVTENPRCNRCCANRSRLCTHSLSVSLLGRYFKNEDYIPPALDALTQILTSQSNLDDVEMVYSNRRNSLVVGLSAALGRPLAASRKNSVFSLHSQGNLNNPNMSLAHPAAATQPPSHSDNSPVRPSSRSSLSFYSYADMVNSDETCKPRPGFRQLLSQSMVPTKRTASAPRVPTMTLIAQKSPVRHVSIKDRGGALNSYLISPDSSDLEEVPARRPSVSSDNDSLVSSTIGDCLRRTTTEINSN